jgi:hypothetical protein
MVVRSFAPWFRARSRACLAGLGALALTACLPEGDPGIGTRWLESRGVGALIVPTAETPGDFVVFGRRDRTSPPEFGPTYQILAQGQPGGEPLHLADGISVFGNGPLGGIVAWDARNRIWALRAAALTSEFFSMDLLRIDVATGSTTALGRAAQAEASPDGKTILVSRRDAVTEVHDLDDHVQPLGKGVGVVSHLGSSLFYSDTIGMHQQALPPVQPSRLLVPGGRNFFAVPGHQADQLFLVDVTIETATESDVIPTRQIGLVRGQDANPTFTTLAKGRFLATPTLSDEGDRVALLDRTEVANEINVRIIDLQTGVETASTFAVHPPNPLPPEIGGPPGPDPRRPLQIEAVFRPRQGDLWLFQDGELAAIVSGATLVPVARSGRRNGQYFGQAFSLDGRQVFTSDGRFWIFVDVQERIQVGDANDPLGPPLLALSESDRHGILLQEIEDGRNLLIFTDQGDRDLRRTDLDGRRMVELAHNAGQVEVGRTRAIAIVDKLSGQHAPGRLVSLDLATGEQTRLGDNVVEFKLMPVCPTCDRTGPGVGLQYVVQARLPYRHDGIWKATLP